MFKMFIAAIFGATSCYLLYMLVSDIVRFFYWLLTAGISDSNSANSAAEDKKRNDHEVS
jgi:hypothetical protein